MKTPPQPHKNDKETRTNESGEVRAKAETRTIEGYALKFDVWSKNLGGFIERIAPGALDGVLEQSDIRCPLNHNQERGLLARADKGEGSLKLSIDETGLKYEFEAPNFGLGDEVLEGVRRGDIKGSSFVFTIEADTWEHDKEADIYKRTITKFKRLYDVSPVYNPAYEDTTVAARSLEEKREQEKPPTPNYQRSNNYKTLL